MEGQTLELFLRDASNTPQSLQIPTGRVALFLRDLSLLTFLAPLDVAAWLILSDLSRV